MADDVASTTTREPLKRKGSETLSPMSFIFCSFCYCFSFSRTSSRRRAAVLAHKDKATRLKLVPSAGHYGCDKTVKSGGNQKKKKRKEKRHTHTHSSTKLAKAFGWKPNRLEICLVDESTQRSNQVRRRGIKLSASDVKNSVQRPKNDQSETKTR